MWTPAVFKIGVPDLAHHLVGSTAKEEMATSFSEAQQSSDSFRERAP